MSLNYQRIDHLAEMLTSAINAGLFESDEGTELEAKASDVVRHLENLLSLDHDTAIEGDTP